MDNIQQTVNMLKGMGDQQLQFAQRDGSVPAYLVVSEMSRRAQLRRAAQGEQAVAQQRMPQPSIAQQLLGSPQQQGPPQQPAPIQSPGFASGGLACMASGGPLRMALARRYDDGGMVVPDPSSVSVQFPQIGDTDSSSVSVLFPQINTPAPRASAQTISPAVTMEALQAQIPRMSPAEAIAMAKALKGDSKDYLGPIADELKAAQALAAAQHFTRKPTVGDALMQAGLAMMASRNPTFLGAAGEGGMAGLAGYRQQQQAYAQDQQRAQQTALALLQHRASLAERQQQGEDQNGSLAGQIMQAEANRGLNLAQVLSNNQRDVYNQQAQDARQQQQQTFDAPYREAKIGELKELEARRAEQAKLAALEAAARSGDKKALADLAAYNRAKEHHEPNPMRDLQSAAIAEYINAGMSPAEALAAMASGKRPKEITQEKRAKAFQDMARTLEGSTMLSDEEKQTALDEYAKWYDNGQKGAFKMPLKNKPAAPKQESSWLDNLFGSSKPQKVKIISVE